MAEDTTSHDAFLERMKNFVAEDPSPRNPRVSTQSSHADRIEAQYQADGHKTWGYVIYRTTYEDEAAWTEFMRRLRFWAADSMESFNGQDVLNKMTWTVFDDKESFDGANVATIRHHFRNWAETAVQREQQQPGQVDGTPVGMGHSPRYRYCVQVDAEALKSAVQDAPPPPDFNEDNQGWVKVIDKNWLPRDEDPRFAGRKPDPNVYEEIDGVAEHNVGWVKCPLPSVMTEYYMVFQDLNGYTISYRRPPAVIGYPWH
ncbi:hypothetical protein KCV07_g6489, partial [Aureobasidium melanogenum]